MGQRAQVQQLLADHGGVITLRDAGGLREAVRWLVRAGDLVPLLPGCYAAAGLADEPLIRAVAMRRYAPDAVLIGRSAAMFTGWPELAPTMLTVAAPDGGCPHVILVMCGPGARSIPNGFNSPVGSAARTSSSPQWI
ncbi:hypothetical protein CGZ95_17565 [Enemella evansiae]|uniref:type IV toxin-antitoxin system AbiEi family antitoxin domain-containing protein n=1 Tax=Enemella evansiae TaxID=2016499 RepID=UPI000B96A8BD|nr:type IV toxin-antitoxin system AbiEi family antitoxin domain-containing protein [Enemella evansiae]OYN95517.1 hypothetical protein CGZ95_17565 [Enemella evansiae]